VIKAMHDDAGAATEIGQLGHVEYFGTVDRANVDVTACEGCDEMTSDEAGCACDGDSIRHASAF